MEHLRNREETSERIMFAIQLVDRFINSTNHLGKTMEILKKEVEDILSGKTPTRPQMARSQSAKGYVVLRFIYTRNLERFKGRFGYLSVVIGGGRNFGGK